jgi:hypothetical protein
MNEFSLSWVEESGESTSVFLRVSHPAAVAIARGLRVAGFSDVSLVSRTTVIEVVPADPQRDE